MNVKEQKQLDVFACNSACTETWFDILQISGIDGENIYDDLLNETLCNSEWL